MCKSDQNPPKHVFSAAATGAPDDVSEPRAKHERTNSLV